ncbi:tryptophan synthase subunit alpha [Alkalihalobacillus trypoxylicola]|uniref:tryptophan synthase subunit alpha n=1 Tax=Alkalihalobacillus trypoxylicola TaxID=519424 RepID=UPI0009EF4180|nr:tryptophan synthase subunit alpha [Alkalihalobacillus trypoxylicola]
MSIHYKNTLKAKTSNRFEAIYEKHEKLFIPFITAGDPCADATIEIALALEEAGASVLELGVPYSDPLADGPIIQEASKRALKAEMTLGKAMKLVPEMRNRGLTIPLVIFTYINPILQYGLEKFVKEAASFGIDGVLVPDLPIEESLELKMLCEAHDMELICLVAPTSKERIEKIAKQAKGFLYCVSSLGVTGVRDELNPAVYEFLKTVKKHTSIPMAVGFGISNAEQVKLMNEFSDGVVVGSALVREIGALENQLKDPKERINALQTIKTFVSSLISS